MIWQVSTHPRLFGKKIPKECAREASEKNWESVAGEASEKIVEGNCVPEASEKNCRREHLGTIHKMTSYVDYDS